ncbi:epimerase [Nannocystaceae bacterium ST9]
MRVVVFGATGAAGRGVLEACLAAPEVEQVIAVVRRSTALAHAKLRESIWTKFDDLAGLEPELVGVDASFYCLGVASAGVSEADYRVVTFDYALAAAKALHAASPGAAFHFISGQGTSATSRFMWARVKGETELALGQLGLARVTCWRPGYIHPVVPRENGSFGDRVARALYPVLRGFAGMSVEAFAIGEAMLEAQRIGRVGIVENREIRALAAAHRAH